MLLNVIQFLDIGKEHEAPLSTAGRSDREENVVPQTQDGDTIVIVGGGSIGLSTAYNLAQWFSDSSLQVRIIVIESFDKPFAVTSSTCTGCFHYGFPEKETQSLLPLGKYSFDLWAAQAESEEFRAATGYRARSSFGVNSGSGHGIDALPDWMETESTWDIDEHVLGSHNATVYFFPNPRLILASNNGHPTATQQASANGSRLSALIWAYRSTRACRL